MTRYTRSKGSKSSNERLPNEATPWYIMKQQLEYSTEKEQVPQAKPKSAKQLLEEKDLYYPDKLRNVRADWAEFENSTSKTIKNSKVEKKLKSQNKKNTEEDIVDNIKVKDEISPPFSQNKHANENKFKRKNDNVSTNSNSNEPEEKKQKIKEKKTLEHETEKINNTLKKKRNPKNTELQSNQYVDKSNDTEVKDSSKHQPEDTRDNEIKLENNLKNESDEGIKKKDVFTKRQKRNQKRLHEKNKDANNTLLDSGEVDQNNEYANNNRKFNNRFDNNIPRKYQKKTAKIRDNKEHFRRKPDYGSYKVTINGMDVEIVKYDGFPVIKKDAERLIDLRKQMVLKGNE
jgi:zinc finger CCHC domain-containing protein 9